MAEDITWSKTVPNKAGWFWFQGVIRVHPCPVKPGLHRVLVRQAYGFWTGLVDGTIGGWILDCFMGRWSEEIPEPADYAAGRGRPGAQFDREKR
jgi:hypothetical protein